jgi:hypothetical protein
MNVRWRVRVACPFGEAVPQAQDSAPAFLRSLPCILMIAAQTTTLFDRVEQSPLKTPANRTRIFRATPAFKILIALVSLLSLQSC